MWRALIEAAAALFNRGAAKANAETSCAEQLSNAYKMLGDAQQRLNAMYQTMGTINDGDIQVKAEHRRLKAGHHALPSVVVPPHIKVRAEMFSLLKDLSAFAKTSHANIDA